MVLRHPSFNFGEKGELITLERLKVQFLAVNQQIGLMRGNIGFSSIWMCYEMGAERDSARYYFSTFLGIRFDESFSAVRLMRLGWIELRIF